MNVRTRIYVLLKFAIQKFRCLTFYKNYSDDKNKKNYLGEKNYSSIAILNTQFTQTFLTICHNTFLIFRISQRLRASWEFHSNGFVIKLMNTLTVSQILQAIKLVLN